MSATKLEKLLINEVSGVDRPANMLDGWIVQKAAGDVDAEQAVSGEEAAEAVSVIAKIRALLTRNEDKENDMPVSEELAKELDERFDAFAGKLEERLTKAAMDAAETAAAATAPEEKVEAETAPALTIEDVTKALEAGIEAALAPVLEVCDKALDRIAAIEKGGVTRKSLDGQEAGETEEQHTPTVGDAIAKAFGA